MYALAEGSGVMGMNVLKTTNCAKNRLVHLLVGRPRTRVMFTGDRDGTNGLITRIRRKLCNRASLGFATRVPFSRISIVFFYFNRNGDRTFLGRRGIPRGIGVVSLTRSFHLTPRAIITARRPAPTTRSFMCNLPRVGRSGVTMTRRITGPNYFTAYVRLNLLPTTGVNLVGDSMSIGTVANDANTNRGPKTAARFS